MKNVVITGTSTGIGLAAAEECIQHGYRVFGSVRRTEDGDRVSAALGENFVPLLFDVTDAAAIQAAADLVQRMVGEAGLAGLVNNAGIGVGGPLMHLPLDELRYQLEVNVLGVLAVTQAFLPLLGARKPCPHPPGRIINISSVAGKVAMPFLGPYNASKHALEALSHTLRRELLPYGIDVIIIGPGAIITPIWDKVDEMDPGPYVDTDYREILEKFVTAFSERSRRHGLPVSAVGRLILETLERDRPRTRYAIVPRRLVNWLLPRYLPARWLDRRIKRNLFKDA